MPAGLRARRFAEKQYTRRLVGLGNSWETSRAPNGGRCVRSDSLGIWRDSEGRGWRGGKTHVESPLRLQRCDTCHPGAGAQGPNRHGYCTQPFPSRRQGLERNLPSLAAEPQLLPGPAGSLVLSAKQCPSQVSTDLFQSLSSGIFRAIFRVRNAALRMVHKASSPAFVYTGHDSRETNTRRTGQEYQGLLPGLTSCGVLKSA